MRGQAHARPGQFRIEPVWIGSAPTPHTAQFVPPHHDRVTALIDDLCAFTARTDLPLLEHVAIAHAQFETIHPFADGNGRTGRALVHAMLRAGGATTRITLPVSAGLLTDIRGYVAALTAYRAGDPDPIVAAFTAAMFAAAANARTLADDLATTLDTWTTRLTARRDAAAWHALPVLLAHPAVTSASLRGHLGVSQPATDHALHQLLDADVLTKAEGYERNRPYIAREVTDAIRAWAAGIRRR